MLLLPLPRPPRPCPCPQAVRTGFSPKPSIPADHKYYSLFSDRVQRKSLLEYCATLLE